MNQKDSNHLKIFMLLGIFGVILYFWQPKYWSEQELKTIEELSIYKLVPLKENPSNAASVKINAAKFGHELFFDTSMSINGRVSCAKCHAPEKDFSDGLTKGIGISFSKRNTRTIIGSAYSPWQYWDGRKDSLWSQALSPLEDPAEHGGNRMFYVHLINQNIRYKKMYENIFGNLPDISDKSRFPNNATPIHNDAWINAWNKMNLKDQIIVNTVFANIGKSIEAYERLIIFGPTKFDKYAKSITNGLNKNSTTIFNNEEIKGLKLFIGKARCTECHNGPLFTNNEFHNTGNLSFPGETPDRGRIDGVKMVLNDPFNCQGIYNDNQIKTCPELKFIKKGIDLLGTIRTPTLRNLSKTAPYGHKGQFKKISDILKQYNEAPLAMIGHNEAENPLNLTNIELKSLESFLKTLDGPLATSKEWLNPPKINY